MEKQLALRYIRLVQQRAIPFTIDEKQQPDFWKAVLKLCQDRKANIIHLLKGNPREDQNCVVYRSDKGDIYCSVYCYPEYYALDVLDLVNKIVDEIYGFDSMPLEDQIYL